MVIDRTEMLRVERRGPRRIGEVLPAVLAQYGIEIDHEERRSDSAMVVFVPVIGDFVMGIPELTSAP
jgi:hypothetical protein